MLRKYFSAANWHANKLQNSIQNNEHSSKCVIYISMIYLINIVTSTVEWMWQWQELKGAYQDLSHWQIEFRIWNFLLLIIFTQLLPLVLTRRWKCEKLLPNRRENCWAIKIISESRSWNGMPLIEGGIISKRIFLIQKATKSLRSLKRKYKTFIFSPKSHKIEKKKNFQKCSRHETKFSSYWM